jgi:pimeloyl-ACP methyl ester carboxylesterase
MVKLAIDSEELGIAKEAEQFMEDYIILDGLPNLPNVPIRVLTSLKLEDGLTLEMLQDWSNSHKALGEGIDDFKHIETDKSGHYIHFDEPELVLNTLNEIID